MIKLRFIEHVGYGMETIKHLLSNCSYFADCDYIRRLNRAFQYILFALLSKYNIIDKLPPWYSPVLIKPSYENDEIWLVCDISEYCDLAICIYIIPINSEVISKIGNCHKVDTKFHAEYTINMRGAWV